MSSAQNSLLTRIDELLLSAHHHLSPDDECYALREYTPGQGFHHSKTNDLISNLKKGVEKKKNVLEWAYKEQAIKQAAKELREAATEAFLEGATIVPMPPSKALSDPLYDDRMVRVASELIAGIPQTDVRALLLTPMSRSPKHQGSISRDLETNRKCLLVNESVTEPTPRRVIVLDDVIVTGGGFRVAKEKLQERYPGLSVIGLFIARSVRQDVSPGT